MDCGICYFTVSQENIFDLECCKNNYVCLDCIERLKKPFCPFCRAKINFLEEKSLSLSCPPSFSFHHHHQNINLEQYSNAYDDIYLTSRILRRQLKRQTKLEDRERDRLQNQYLSSIYRQSRH